jgi:hypothetical protein
MHAEVPENLREVVGIYLKGGSIRYIAAGLDVDEISGAWAVPIGNATDGLVSWPLACRYYTAQHGVGLPEALLDHIQEQLAARPGIATGDEPVFLPRGALIDDLRSGDTSPANGEDSTWTLPASPDGDWSA